MAGVEAVRHVGGLHLGGAGGGWPQAIGRLGAATALGRVGREAGPGVVRGHRELGA
jgi:hypothetical protein